jgi:hypothetical protein
MNCKRCGAELTGRQRLYCSGDCHVADYNAKRRRPAGPGTCRNCGKDFEKSCKTQAYCSPACKASHEATGKLVGLERECAQCGSEFLVTSENKKYCPDCKVTIDPAQETRTRLERDRKKRELSEALLDEAQRTQVVEELVSAQERVEGWTPRPFNITLGRKFPAEHANMVFGDWHIGEKITKEESGGLAEYDMAIARRRLERCVASQAEIVGIQNAGGIPIKHCNVWLLGDIVTGEKIFKGQHAYIDAYTADQVVYAKNLLGEVLLNMLSIYDTISCHCVVGNHGRMGEKGEGPTWNNFDYLLYNWTADLLKNYPQIKWNIPRSWFTIAEPMGWKVCLSHGDDVKMFQRIPWYGLERDVNDMSAMLWDIEQSPPNYWLYAHFHTMEQAEQVHGERLMNGSVVGGSMLSAKALKRVSRPSQTYFQLSKSKGITARYSLWLDDKKR